MDNYYHNVPSLLKDDWEWVQKSYFFMQIGGTKSTLGDFLLDSFPDLEYDLRRNSNLGTPGGVYSMSDDVIIRLKSNPAAAIRFIESVIEII